MKLDLSLKQTQKLAMTTELRQSIEILQYNNFELINYLVKESEENPTIELDLPNIEYDYYSAGSNKNYSKSGDDEETDIGFERFVSEEETLHDYVYEQLISTDLSLEKRKIGEYLLGLMDESGYIKGDLYEFSNKYNFSFEDVEEVLKVLQDFYPVGVCATTLSECLTKQALKKGYDDLVLSIINEDLVDMAENRVSILADKYKKSNKEIQTAFDKIRSLEPRPGRFMSFSSNPTKFIIPDLILEIENNEIFLYFNEDSFPKVSYNRYYKSLMEEKIEKDAREYLKDKFRSTNWIIKSIEQRRETIYKVATAIINKQKDYILGKAPLVPMTMEDISKEVDVHESTVSRTVNGKYIQAPNKIYELKDFFKGGIETDTGKVSVDEIKLFIKTSIETEDKKNPLSDQDITDKLNNLGYQISRRTVAKYRSSMNILSSTKRKRY